MARTSGSAQSWRTTTSGLAWTSGTLDTGHDLLGDGGGATLDGAGSVVNLEPPRG